MILETTVGARDGTVDRATDESERFGWLIETAGHGDVVIGQYGGPFDTEDLSHPAFKALENAEGIVSSLTVEDEETLAGDFTSIIEDPDEDSLDGILGASADKQSVVVDGDRVFATATLRDEVRYE